MINCVWDDFSVLRLRGVYSTTHALWLKTVLANRATVPFAVGCVKFFIRERRPGKNAAVQEREVFPIYTSVPDTVRGRSKEQLLLAFDPFVLHRHQQLILQIGERRGNRFIELVIRARHFARARVLP